MGRACRYIGISRQAYYKRQQSETRQSAREAKVCALVNHLRLRQPRLGTRKLQHVLRTPLAEAGIQVGRDRLFDILRAARLLVVPQRAYHKTTQSSSLPAPSQSAQGRPEPGHPHRAGAGLGGRHYLSADRPALCVPESGD